MNNKNILKYGILVLGILIIIIGLVSLNGNNDSSNDNEPSINNQEENNNQLGKNEKVYICENKLVDDETGYTSYQIETVYVDDGIAKKTVPTMKLVCNNKEIYNVLKNDKEYSEGKNFDDDSLTITFKNGEEVSLEKDVIGNEIEMKFIDYEKQLKDNGYTCKEK